ncbi:MAG: prenyltransferase, partial [Actinomycetota bacterium]|nr:prenyltransferase [Actinomycetota bacterium]
IQTVPDAFAPKNRWAMDWYYPVLSGVVTGEMGIKHLAEKNETFEIPGKGIRCVSDRPWITTAETCECALAFQSIGEIQHALELFKQIQKFRNHKGQYLTGVVYPESVSFPEEEYSTYSAAAVVLAADSLMGITKASQLFSNHEFLPVL